MDATDKKLLALLEINSRESTASLARNLGLSRSTVQDRISRLERQNVIQGYTIRFSEHYSKKQLKAHIMLNVDMKLIGRVVNTLQKIPEIKSLEAVSGIHDFIAIAKTDSPEEMDELLDKLGQISGIEKTTTSIVLSMKFEH